MLRMRAGSEGVGSLPGAPSTPPGVELRGCRRPLEVWWPCSQSETHPRGCFSPDFGLWSEGVCTCTCPSIFSSCPPGLPPLPACPHPRSSCWFQTPSPVTCPLETGAHIPASPSLGSGLCRVS